MKKEKSTWKEKLDAQENALGLRRVLEEECVELYEGFTLAQLSYIYYEENKHFSEMLDYACELENHVGIQYGR